MLLGNMGADGETIAGVKYPPRQKRGKMQICLNKPLAGIEPATVGSTAVAIVLALPCCSLSCGPCLVLYHAWGQQQHFTST